MTQLQRVCRGDFDRFKILSLVPVENVVPPPTQQGDPEGLQSRVVQDILPSLTAERVTVSLRSRRTPSRCLLHLLLRVGCHQTGASI